MVNNISYADDMVLLCPSISALVKLLKICEEYARTHGLRYNTSKSELLVFKAGSKSLDMLPDVFLCGTPLKKITRFKYLGHWVTDNLKDDMDMERERRALTVTVGATTLLYRIRYVRRGTRGQLYINNTQENRFPDAPRAGEYQQSPESGVTVPD
ncbi:uncharacterized protein LOC134753002 [Cydia strobilella]|uniref:uncharacterized protein LOC134753002 n=1 Tax=Cydia strobilella TaxID=1100964 RepID=UPI00300706C4